MDTNLARFKAETAPFIDNWKSIDMRLIASRSGEKWTHGAIRMVLDSSPPSTPTRTDLPTVEGVMLAHERWDIARLDEILTWLSNCEFKLGDQLIEVKALNTSPPISYRFERLTRQQSQQKLLVGSYCLYIAFWSSNQMIEGNTDPIESALRSAKVPWDGLMDLLTNFLNISPNFLRSIPAAKLVEIIAPLAVHITKASLVSENKIIVVVEVAPSISASELSLSVIGYVKDNTQVRIHNSMGKMIDETHVSFEVTFPERVSLVVSVLTYRGLDIDRFELLGKVRRGTNPRLVILQSQEDGVQGFIDLLRLEKDKYFEDKVSILFQVLGLSAGHYGRTHTDGPDVLVFPDSDDWMMDIECTEAAPDLNNKLSKLATRTKLLRGSTNGIPVYPVLVTKFPKDMINKTDNEKAGKEEISIITSDDFEHLLQMAIEGTDQSKVRDYILSLVPRTSPIGQAYVA